MVIASQSAAELHFDEEQHRYFLGGRELPSVTRVLSMLDKFEHVPADVLERAREFGQHVHMACELDNRGLLDEAALDPALRPYLEGWRRFVRDSGFQILSSEERVMHARLGYAGTLDVSGMLNRMLSLLDIKSGILPRTVGYQTAAYCEGYVQKHGKRPARRYCLQLNPDFATGYKLHRLQNSGDFNVFVSALNIYKVMNDL